MTIVDPDIASDGSVDVSSDLQAWLNDPKRDDTQVIFPLFRVYRCEKPVTVTGRRFSVLGRGCQIKRTMLGGQRGDRHLSFRGCDVSIRSLVVQGSAPRDLGYDKTLEAQHAFEALGCTRFELVNCRAYDVWGDKVYLGPLDGTWTQQVLIKDFRGGVSHRHCMAVTAARSSAVVGGDFGEAKRACVDFEGNGPTDGCIDFHADQVRFGKHRLRFIAAAAGWGRYENITFTDCINYGSNLGSTIGNPDPRAIFRNWTIIGCRGETDPGGSGAVFNFSNVTDVRVRDNVNPFYAARMRFASFTDCSGDVEDADNRAA